MSYMYFLKIASVIQIPMWIFSAIMFLFQNNNEKFTTRLAVAVVIALIYKLLDLDTYTIKESKQN